jgi:ubiquinone/menaquinone biosynthesis C-methylase UbiE
MNMNKNKEFMRENIYAESYLFHKIIDTRNADYLESVINNWHYEENNYDGRWKIMEQFNEPEGKKILDFASGVGTFVLHGLNKGYDVYGVEPSEWKLEYVKNKIRDKSYPTSYVDRFVKGVGESLPFDDDSFDFITSYQTLEHVQDIETCLYEMFRVLKPGGRLWLQAPDYNSWFEPHYRLPFLPTMNRSLAKFYLNLISRPSAGLSTLQWTTAKKVLSIIKKDNFCQTNVFDVTKFRSDRAVNFFSEKHKLPHFLSRILIKILGCKVMFKQEVHINMLITKSL